MTLFQQIIWGSMYLSGSLLLETIMLVWCVDALRKHSRKSQARHPSFRNLTTMMIAIGFIIVAHTAQVWVWAAKLMTYDIFADWNTALYFAIATYTTLGYGDIILEPDLRIFAAFAAMTGMLAFGISTAFLVSVTRPMFPATATPASGDEES